MSANTAFVSNSGDMSQATLTIGPMDIRTVRTVAVACNYTGAPVGSLQLQGLVDNQTGAGTGQGVTWSANNWVNQGTAVSVNGAGSYVWDVTSSVSALRVVYTKTSGTGTLTALWQPKGRV